MDGEARHPAGALPSAAWSREPENQEPTSAAELYVVLLPGNSAGRQQEIAEWTGSRGGTRGLQRLGVPAVGMRVTVPSAQAGQLLRVFERVALAVTWQATVIGSLVGGAAAHLPPAGTTIVVVLELAIPPVLLLRLRRRGNDNQNDRPGREARVTSASRPDPRRPDGR